MIRKFIDEKLEKDLKSFETAEDLYKSYKSFCEKHSVTPLTKIRFGKQLDNLNIGVKHSKMQNRVILYGRQGVRLK